MAKDKVIIPIDGDNAGLKESLSQSESDITKFASKVTAVLAVIGVAVLAKKAVDLGRKFVELSNIQEQAEAKMTAVLKATGNAAGYSADQMKILASAMQGVSTSGDEANLEVISLLATFRNVRGDVFKEAAMSALDMATVMGGDAKGAALQLGKALNDPLKGISALSRAGVTFSDEQKKMIESMVEAGDVAGAQGVILDELKGEFGGAAAAMADTFGGQMQQRWNELGDVGEQFGAQIKQSLVIFLPLVDMMIGGLQHFADVTGKVMNYVVERGQALVNGVTPYFEGLVQAVVFSATYIEVEFSRIGDTWTMLKDMIALRAIQIGSVIAHVFTEVVPKYLKWFANNWVNIFIDMAKATSTIVNNMAVNLVDFFFSITRWLKGEGFDFKWTGLLDGFEASMDELPEIAERKKGQLETFLETEINDIQTSMANEAAQKVEDRMGKLRNFFSRKAAPTLDDVGDANLTGEIDLGAAEKDKKSKNVGLESIEQMIKRIDTAAATSPELEEAKKQTGMLADSVAEQKITNHKLDAMLTKAPTVQPLAVFGS